jgi:8-oxo-dGTP pyrophosphatase MutT (NUDIX family)
MSHSYDPELVPVQDAATVLLVDDRDGAGRESNDEDRTLQVLCLRRRAGSAFVGGMTVFPGGGLDDEDHDPRYESRTRGLTAEDADARLDLPGGGLAYWIAVARETFEEVGVLLGRSEGGRPLPDDVARHRHAVDAGERTLLDVLEAEKLELDLGAVFDIGRWITPVGAPRRYDTRFFIARMPAGQVAIVDDVEAVHCEWRTPRSALDGWISGELVMLPPTVCLLQVLERFETAGELLDAAAASRGPGDLARIDGPDRGDFKILLPGDPGYDGATTRETLGWVYRL